MDGYNTLKQHAIVGILSLISVLILFIVAEAPLPAAFARTSFFLLFITLAIGPMMKIKAPSKVTSPLMLPWTWRGELGIWFTITGLAHFILLALDRPLTSFIQVGGSGYALANLLGAVALFWAIVLSATSSSKAIKALGVSSWKWIQNFAYLIFYLIAGHYLYFQFFSTYGENPGPDWFGWVALAMTLLVIALELVAFVVVVKKGK